MAKTNDGLVNYAKAQLGKPYWYGTFGNTASKSLLNSKKNAEKLLLIMLIENVWNTLPQF